MENINVAKIVKDSVANGPGHRISIWLQGCNKRCPGCNNVEMQPHIVKKIFTAEQLIDEIGSLDGIEGITISGGEPLLQYHQLIPFFKKIREIGLSIVSYTGFEFDEIPLDISKSMKNYIDVLITGPFIQNQIQYKIPMIGSSNQHFYFLTERYSLNDFKEIPNFEIYIENDQIMIDGIISPEMLEKVKISLGK